MKLKKRSGVESILKLFIISRCSSFQKSLQNSAGRPFDPNDFSFLKSFKAFKHSAETFPSQDSSFTLSKGVMFSEKVEAKSFKCSGCATEV